jgi:hypothetical protein
MIDLAQAARKSLRALVDPAGREWHAPFFIGDRLSVGDRRGPGRTGSDPSP